MSRKVVKKLLEKINFLKKAHKNGYPSSVVIPNALEKDTKPKMVYRLVENSDITEELFRRMQTSLVEKNQMTRQSPMMPPRLIQEWGKLPEGRRFFFLQPWGGEGLLFEEEKKGWIISRAHKIPEKHQFMRSSEAWDVVNVFVANWEESLPRLSSSRFGNDLMSFPLYQEALMTSLSSNIGLV